MGGIRFGIGYIRPTNECRPFRAGGNIERYPDPGFRYRSTLGYRMTPRSGLNGCAFRLPLFVPFMPFCGSFLQTPAPRRITNRFFASFCLFAIAPSFSLPYNESTWYEQVLLHGGRQRFLRGMNAMQCWYGMQGLKVGKGVWDSIRVKVLRRLSAMMEGEGMDNFSNNSIIFYHSHLALSPLAAYNRDYDATERNPYDRPGSARARGDALDRLSLVSGRTRRQSLAVPSRGVLPPGTGLEDPALCCGALAGRRAGLRDRHRNPGLSVLRASDVQELTRTITPSWRLRAGNNPCAPRALAHGRAGRVREEEKEWTKKRTGPDGSRAGTRESAVWHTGTHAEKRICILARPSRIVNICGQKRLALSPDLAAQRATTGKPARGRGHQPRTAAALRVLSFEF